MYSSGCINQTWFCCILGARSSHRPEAEKTSLPSSATNAPISATSSSSSSGRPPRSASGSSPWAAAEGSTSSSGMYRTLGTTQSLSTSSVRETYRAQGSAGMTDFTEVADSSLTHSHSPSEGPSPGEQTLESKYQFSYKPKEDCSCSLHLPDSFLLCRIYCLEGCSVIFVSEIIQLLLDQKNAL